MHHTVKKLLIAALTWLVGPIADAELPVRYTASFYADHYQGKTMANGKPYLHRNYTCATWDYPLGTKLLVRYTSVGEQERSVIVVVTDRGPKKSLGSRIDLSQGAFRQLESLRLGIIPVTVQPIK